MRSVGLRIQIYSVLTAIITAHFVFFNSGSILISGCLLLAIVSVLELKIFHPIQSLEKEVKTQLGELSSDTLIPKSQGYKGLGSDLKCAAQNLKTRMMELEELDRARSEFISITSHELRTPLTSIKGSLSLLTSGTLGGVEPATLRMLEIAESETDRLISLTNELLDLAKMEAKQMKLSPEWISAQDIINEVAASFTGLAGMNSIRIEAQVEPQIELYVDPARFKQIAQNLLSNAIKHSPPSGVIEFTLETEEGQAKLTVKDEGPGIAPHDAELIFEKFRQGRGENRPGTGLGLSIARELATLHGGSIQVQSQLGQGAAFTVYFPTLRVTPNIKPIKKAIAA